MAKFLNTSATSYYLEELIKNAKERLCLISPYLKLNNRIKELLEDKDRLKIDVRIVYGKSELQPAEANWLKQLQYVRTSYCHNLHAKCYVSEAACIITSLNLYDFSQINNNEMGILIARHADADLYKDAYAEAQRIIRISDEVKISVDVVEKSDEPNEADTGEEDGNNLLTAAKLAEKHQLKTAEINQKLCDLGLQEQRGRALFLTEMGRQQGGKTLKGPYGFFNVWPQDILLEAS